MAKGRLDKTLADYVVIALSPALVMTLVGSLVFFLLDVSYRGQFESRIHWIMFWYVFAAVLVARIAIVEGREHAQIFGVAMCAVAALAVFRFVDAVVVGLLLLAVVWWCSSKLTWDCTLIDESVDTSGEGLLQSAGFDNAAAGDAAQTESRDRDSHTDSSTSRKNKKNKRKKSTAIDDVAPKKPEPNELPADDDEGEKKPPHAPGLWVVYFSLAALPLFGVGQLFIPVSESGRRSYEFVLLMVYVASAILLLLTTSFLSLRRYLRQRKLEMPASVTRGWLGMGCALLLSLLLLAVVIPRPQGEYTLTGMIDKIDSKVRQASRHAVLPGDRAQGEGPRKGEQDPNAKQPGDGRQPKPSDKDQQGEKGQDNSKKGNRDGGDQNGQSQSKSQQSGDGKRENQQTQSRDQSREKSNKTEKNGKESEQPRQQNNGERQNPDNQRPNDQGQTRSQDRNTVKTPVPVKDDPAKTPSSKSTSLSETSLTQMLAPLVKWILYGVLALVGLYFLIRYWSRFADFLARLWAELLSLFIRQSEQKDKTNDELVSVSQPVRPFASYENPFYSGAADRMSPPQLIRYTFEALEAWSREQAIERLVEQTPLEFAQELGERVPDIAREVAQTAQLYAHVAYARKVPSRDRLEVLERLWRRLVV